MKTAYNERLLSCCTISSSHFGSTVVKRLRSSYGTGIERYTLTSMAAIYGSANGSMTIRLIEVQVFGLNRQKTQSKCA